MDRAPSGDVHKLVRVFQLWKEEMGADATQYNLRKQLDQYSDFAGRKIKYAVTLVDNFSKWPEALD